MPQVSMRCGRVLPLAAGSCQHLWRAVQACVQRHQQSAFCLVEGELAWKARGPDGYLLRWLDNLTGTSVHMAWSKHLHGQ